MVCTDVGGNPELVKDGENGFVVPPKDPQRLADAIAQLLADQALGETLGQRGRERFNREFTLVTMVKKYEDLYLELWEKRALAGRGRISRKEAERA